mgnify:CR=1 FL=1
MTQHPPAHFGRKRYYAYNRYLRDVFGHKVFKVPLDAGFTCPNRDGTVGEGGCAFCSERGSGDFAGGRGASLAVQFDAVRAHMRKKWDTQRCIAYFQAFTNTYAPVDRLRACFEEALRFEGVAGLAVATRPDCLPPGVVEYLAELHQRTFLWVELGLQTVHEATAAQMNRGHGYGAYLEGLAALRRHGIRVCVHIINGLPGESPAMMRATARAVAAQDVQGIKIHLLHVMEGTPLGERYRRAPFPLLEQDVYVALVCDQLELLPPGMVIHRLTGDAPRDTLLGPAWSVNKWEVLNAIDWELERRGTWQGCRAASPPPSARP